MITMDIKELDELERKLTALGEEVGTKILRDAGREALKVVQEDMINHAGFDESSTTQHMRDSIKIRTNKGKGGTVVVLRVGPSKEHYIKALAQEYGTVKQIPSPFIRPAMDYNRVKIIQILTTEIRYGIKKHS